MLPVAHQRYLHPDRCYEYQKSLSNYSANNNKNNYSYSTYFNHYNNNFYSSQSYGPPPMSPMGLKEVLSSYTPGPTIIMMEKKKKPSIWKTMHWRILCILILCIFGFFIIGATLYSKIDENLNSRVDGSPVPHPELNIAQPHPFTPHFHHDDNIIMKNSKDNFSGYSYLHKQNNYLNVIHSLDDDDESYVEVVQLM